MVKVENLTKYYGKFLALDNINFAFNKGDAVGLLGPNGAGKSTTMKILSGYMAPSKGNVLINDVSVADSPLETKKYIGYLPEHAPLYLDMRVRDYLNYVAKLKMVAKTNLNRFVDEALEQTNLEDVQNKYIKALSKGYRQRLGIAQALVSKPDLIILDEPTVGLDPKQVSEIRQLLKNLARDRTLLLSSHILSEIELICNKVVVINKGKILAQEKIENLTKQAVKTTFELQIEQEVDWTKVPLRDLGIKDIVARADGWVEFSLEKEVGSLNEVMKVFISQNIPFVQIRKKGNSLEEVYLNLIQEQTP